MTEAEWLACTDPTQMLEFLAGRASDRKLRLFACACCRRIWHLLTDSRLREIVQAAENFADGIATEDAMRSLWLGIVADSATQTVLPDAYHAVGGAAFGNREMPPGYGPDTWAVANTKHVGRKILRLSENREAELVAQCATLRCLFSTPFRLTPTLPSIVLVWNDGTVVKLAQGISDDRAFDRLPVLADALEDAGCTDADILAHCRQDALHVRGCWVVDLLLFKG